MTKASVPTNEPQPIEFRPIGVIGRPNEAPPPLLAAPEGHSAVDEHREERISKIEIALPNGVRGRVHASVSEKALSRVLRATMPAEGNWVFATGAWNL